MGYRKEDAMKARDDAFTREAERIERLHGLDSLSAMCFAANRGSSFPCGMCDNKDRCLHIKEKERNQK